MIEAVPKPIELMDPERSLGDFFLFEKGGERHETVYDSKGCPLQQGLLMVVLGMTLNCPEVVSKPYLIRLRRIFGRDLEF
jgi:hypothetical protein